MDLLQKELQRKKQALAKAKEAAALEDDVKNNNDPKGGNLKSKRFLRVGELRRIQEEQEEEEQQRRQQEQRLLQKKRQYSSTTTNTNTTTKDNETTEKVNETVLLSNQEPLKKKKKKKKKNKSATETTTTKEGEGEGKYSSLTNQEEDETDTNNIDSNNNNKKKKQQEQQQHEQQVQIKKMIYQFRQLGLPILLFGETNLERQKRFQQAVEQQSHLLQGVSEMDEFRLGRGHGIRNQFLEKESKDEEDIEIETNNDDLNHNTNNNNKDQQQNKGNHHNQLGDNNSATDKNTTTTTTAEKNTLAGTGTGGTMGGQNEGEGNDEDEEDDDIPKKIYNFLKGLLKQWEEDLAHRPDSIKKSVSGRNESKTLKQCKDYIRPLFKLCKTRRLEPGLQAHLNKIVGYAIQGEFVMAHDAYIDVAIGRAAWPIGVTMVGIHARSGRAKIESANVAHVMNSELQRKYLTSVKRLLTYAQKKRTDVDPSKKVL